MRDAMTPDTTPRPRELTATELTQAGGGLIIPVVLDLKGRDVEFRGNNSGAK